MLRLDHLRLPVTDLARSRGWSVETLGPSVEFEVPQRVAVAPAPWCGCGTRSS
jgi:hypothetical protein